MRSFEPLEPGKASIYLCGLTVQGPPHIGHVRNWVTIDILRRWLDFNGLDVTYVRNITDIDDRIISRAAENGKHKVCLEGYGYRWYRVGGLDYLLKRSEF